MRYLIIYYSFTRQAQCVADTTEAKRVFDGRPFGVHVVCRRLWKKNLAIVRELAEKAGGRFIDRAAFAHGGSEIGSLLQTMTYVHRSDDGMRSAFGLRLPAYGVSPPEMERVAPFTLSLLERIAS